MTAHILRRVGVGVLSGASGGMATGIGARVAMRMVADAIGKFGEFTIEGTLIIILLGIILGSALGVLYVAVEPFLPGGPLVRGLVFGVALLVVLGLPMLLQPATGELALAPELGKRLFGALFVVEGVGIALAESLCDRRLQPPRRALSSVLGYGLLLALGVLGLGMFALMFATVVFGPGN